jgi:DNA repair and recombination protein RAD54B
VPKGYIPPKSDSGKLAVLANLLHILHSTTSEKIVLVSNFTSTLNVLQNLLSSKRYSWCRLDGDTDQNKRQQIVDNFNRVDAKTCCTPWTRKQVLTKVAFLLSSKSGGCGLNLVGASRLVLFDVDWNPSTDLQSMARIHRDGQTRKVYIYRFLTYLPQPLQH